MTLQDQLDRLLNATSDLGLVAFGDLTSGLILNHAAKAPCPRELLDLLGEKAADSFAFLADGPDLPTGEPIGAAALMIHFTERQTQVFARAPGSPEDVICAVCRPGASLAPVLHATLALADKIAGPP